MDQTISSIDYDKPRRLERLVSYRYPSPQQLGKFHYWFRTQQTPYQMGTTCYTAAGVIFSCDVNALLIL